MLSLGAAAEVVVCVGSRGLEEREEPSINGYLIPQDPGIAAAAAAGVGWDRVECGELEKLCGFCCFPGYLWESCHIQS